MQQSVDWFYYRDNCKTCLRFRSQLDQEGIRILCERSCLEAPVLEREASALLHGIDRVIVFRGHRFSVWRPGSDLPTDFETKYLLNPHRELRVPAARAGNILLIGFNERHWKRVTNEICTMKYAICNEVFEGWDFAKTCRYSKELGYDGIEIAPFTLADSINEVSQDERAKLRQTAQDAGIEIIGLHWLLAKTEGLHLTHPDEGMRSRTADYIGELAKACSEMGGNLMVFGSPQQRSLQPGVSIEQAMDWAAATFQSVMPRLADFGVTLCMEPLAPTETDFIQTCAEARQLIDRVKHPRFVLHQDVKAMSSESESIPDLIRQYADVTHHFHANDENLRGPGFGDVDFVPIFQSLADTRYDGWVSVEVFDYKPDPETIARESIRYMKDCWAQVT